MDDQGRGGRRGDIRDNVAMMIMRGPTLADSTARGEIIVDIH